MKVYLYEDYLRFVVGFDGQRKLVVGVFKLHLDPWHHASRFE